MKTTRRDFLKSLGAISFILTAPPGIASLVRNRALTFRVEDVERLRMESKLAYLYRVNVKCNETGDRVGAALFVGQDSPMPIEVARDILVEKCKAYISEKASAAPAFLTSSSA